MSIKKAQLEDLQEILTLQYLSYQSEADLIGTNDIPPLKQTISEVVDEYKCGTILKMVAENNVIIGSVRAQKVDGTVYIGKLMVHPDYRGKGFGTKLLIEIEQCFPDSRYELFTSTKSVDNIRLYQKLGYKIFSKKVLNSGLVFVYMEKCI
ncbi:MAG: GNAT family N-acetyltransferase [Clostridia bacterium]|nr:GNAT family N-acetyltransferase [Clostridia bacterium]